MQKGDLVATYYLTGFRWFAFVYPPIPVGLEHYDLVFSQGRLREIRHYTTDMS